MVMDFLAVLLLLIFVAFGLTTSFDELLEDATVCFGDSFALVVSFEENPLLPEFPGLTFESNLVVGCSISVTEGISELVVSTSDALVVVSIFDVLVVVSTSDTLVVVSVSADLVVDSTSYVPGSSATFNTLI